MVARLRPPSGSPPAALPTPLTAPSERGTATPTLGPVSWVLVPSPTPPAGTMAANLTGLSCVSLRDCWAVGWVAQDNGPGGDTPVQSVDEPSQALIEQNVGSGWSIVPSPNIPIGSDGVGSLLSSVTCVTASDCWAVGDSLGGTLIEHDGGDGWSLVTSPDPGQPWARLNAVTCVGAGDCWAVGTLNNTAALIEQDTGDGWTIVTSPVAGAGASLNGVTCISASDCIAVGYYIDANQMEETLIEQNTGGGWTIVPSPTPPVTPVAYDGVYAGVSLRAVTCVGPSSCWAVGEVSDSSTSTASVIEKDAGDGWSLVSGPSPAGGGGLLGVTCIAAADCWAVGPGVEHETDGAWSIVSSPTPPWPSGLDDVVCIDSRDCWAGGITLGSRDTGQTLIERTQ